ncbi:TonB-dependent receptor [Novosphingobium sp. 9U]|uniref:TonB-dependent receptor n=1 Tax=Novosphingobium sp. 9U TaxID=2653158 RepID=UPI0012F26488|nr:TonB-dependent receptor [Novosphingobium sp. 9U]VWX49582.1 Iron complex outermembrane recepter protein [Novosphingobium sp. 9U]
MPISSAFRQSRLLTAAALMPVPDLAAPALAQESAAPAPSTAPALAPEDDSIVVTAQRRSERSRDVPVSITAISAEQITQLGLQQLNDVAKVTPGLRFDYVGTFVQPTIRGVGTSFATSGGLGNVAIYVDGFYSPNPLGSDFQLSNVENVQVLKGPQGTLFGRNTTGGAILVTTAKPSTEAAAKFEASYGSFDTARLQGYATFGLADNVAIDIEGMYKRGDGFATDIVDGDKDVGRYRIWGVRTGVKVDLGDDAYVLVRYGHNDTNDPTANVANAYVLDGVPLSAGLHPAVQSLLGPSTVATKYDDVALTVKPSFRTKSNAVQGTVSADLGSMTLTSYTQYRKENSYSVSDLDYSTASLFSLFHPIINKTFTQEFLLNSNPGGRLQWTAGAFYVSFVDHYNLVLGSAFGAPPSPIAESSTTTTSLAAFADATYQLTDKLFLTAGLRYSHDGVRDSYFDLPNAAGGLTRTDVPSLKSDRVTPRVVIRYKPTTTSSVYASFTRGYKPGFLNVGGASLDGIEIAPEKIQAWEVGYKYETRGAAFDAAAYYYDYKNLQVSSYNGTQSLITNAASARIYGLEVQGRVRPLDGLDLSLAGAYTNAKYRNFDTAPFYDLDQPFLYVIGPRPNGASGQQMLRAPKFTGTFSARYAFELGGGRFALSGNLYHTSAFAFDAAGQFHQGGYETVNLRAEWTDPSDQYTFALYGENVTDARYRTQVLPSVFGIGNVWSYPATIGASVRVKIGGVRS